MRTLLAIGGCISLMPFACSRSAQHETSADGAPTSTVTADSGPAIGDGGVEVEDGDIDSSSGSGGEAGQDGGFPSGWLYTVGGQIFVSNGSAQPTAWMGRGVNVDDIFLCGYNSTLGTTSPDQTLEAIIAGLMSTWKPSFLRISLGMDSNSVITSWLGTNAAQYKTPMTKVIQAIGAYPGVHVLVTLRSDASMIGQDTQDGDPEATGIPSDSTTTPNATMFPTGTDATYIALVDSFANSGFVMFGLTNEPGGNKRSNATLAAAMNHAVGVIRAEEDRLRVPHHIVSVQGNNWTSEIGFYAGTADGGLPDGGAGLIAYDNVVYEVHGYPPAPSSYTFPNIPVIIGEYGSLSNSAAFYTDVEAKQIPNLAWDFEPYSNCAPDLVNVTHSATSLTPTAWGTTVQSYLLKP